jgi:hypothetical protein
MNSLEYREFSSDDFEAVMSLDLRPIEVRESWASAGVTPEEALAHSIGASRYVWVITCDDKVCGVFGLAIQEQIGIPWLLSNEVPFALRESRGLFLRTSKQIVMLMLSKVDMLVNIVSLENVDSVCWLRWLGFTIDETKTFTFDRDPNLHFVSCVLR